MAPAAALLVTAMLLPAAAHATTVEVHPTTPEVVTPHLTTPHPLPPALQEPQAPPAPQSQPPANQTPAPSPSPTPSSSPSSPPRETDAERHQRQADEQKDYTLREKLRKADPQLTDKEMQDYLDKARAARAEWRKSVEKTRDLPSIDALNEGIEKIEGIISDVFGLDLSSNDEPLTGEELLEEAADFASGTFLHTLFDDWDTTKKN